MCNQSPGLRCSTHLANLHEKATADYHDSFTNPDLTEKEKEKVAAAYHQRDHELNLLALRTNDLEEARIRSLEEKRADYTQTFTEKDEQDYAKAQLVTSRYATLTRMSEEGDDATKEWVERTKKEATAADNAGRYMSSRKKDTPLGTNLPIRNEERAAMFAYIYFDGVRPNKARRGGKRNPLSPEEMAVFRQAQQDLAAGKEYTDEGKAAKKQADRMEKDLGVRGPELRDIKQPVTVRNLAGRVFTSEGKELTGEEAAPYLKAAPPAPQETFVIGDRVLTRDGKELTGEEAEAHKKPEPAVAPPQEAFVIGGRVFTRDGRELTGDEAEAHKQPEAPKAPARTFRVGGKDLTVDAVSRQAPAGVSAQPAATKATQPALPTPLAPAPVRYRSLEEAREASIRSARPVAPAPTVEPFSFANTAPEVAAPKKQGIRGFFARILRK